MQVLLRLLQPQARLVLRGAAQHKGQICHAAHKGHELHRRRRTLCQQIRIDTGQVVKQIPHCRDQAKAHLHGGLIARDCPHGRRHKVQQPQQQRQRQRQLRRGLHLRPAGHQRRQQQRQPAPQLAAQIGRQHRNGRPQQLPLEDGQHQHQRHMGHQRVQQLQQLEIGGHAIDRRLRQQDRRHGQSIGPLLPPRPRDAAEGGGQDHAVHAHRRVVQQRHAVPQRVAAPHGAAHHSSTCFRLKAYSRYRSFSSENRPWGMGISV